MEGCIHITLHAQRGVQFNNSKLRRSKRKVFVAEIFNVGDALDILALGTKVVLLHTVEEDHAHEEQENDARETYHQETAGVGGEEARKRMSFARGGGSTSPFMI
jgi:hypothetical protein